MLDFVPLALAHQPLVEKYMRLYGEGSCQHSMASMFCFDNKYGHSVCERNGWLFVCREKISTPEYRSYFLPMGEGNLAEPMDLLREDAHARGARVKLETVTERARDRLEACCPGRFSAEERRDYAEYLYTVEKLANLPGSEMASKRHDVRVFWRSYEDRVTIAPMTPETAGRVRAYQAEWLKTRMRSEDKVQLELENEAILRGIDNFGALGLSGILLYLDGALRGYAYGAELSDAGYDVMIEKGDREVKDIYRILNMELVRRCCAGLRYVNREEDLGVPGLRKAKLSYKPDILLNKYILKEVAADE